ncbi:hypothetical protein [Marinilactibacillus kalidii]|uniref:hypothetical protein n=1 Tax=Marinilactibacillus kalidii TaxID=2820274 RepID=UPI001ABE0FE0|nr:hypothetical protein [Marinilactibacillus kalidii]
MKKEFRTLTYGAEMTDGAMRLKVETQKEGLFADGVEVKANVDMETGEVKFFIDPSDLEAIQD